MAQGAVDLHCDALTEKFSGRVKAEKLKNCGIRIQCLAAFTEDDSAAAYAAAVALFKEKCKREGFAQIKNYADFVRAEGRGDTCLALTAENIGFTLGDRNALRALKEDGVIMASPVWNNENALAYPNARADLKRETRGLKRAGRDAVAALDELKIIVDISHLSDGGAYEILRGSKIPTVASHSCADGVFSHPRNLTDGLIKLVADCGGVVGVNYCKKFLGGGSFEVIAAHIERIIKVGGEDCAALGGDWDGVKDRDCALFPEDMPEFLNFLDKRFGVRVAQKIAADNFLRVFKEVC